jgi:UDP-N-acetylmuramoyl-tripeptide--D-alanyl-D-alanine ligase
MAAILQRIFKLLAQFFVWRTKPVIVAVTGTVGKTSAREAIAAVLASKYRVRTAKKNYNNEWGAPFTVLSIEGGGGRSPVVWAKVIFRALVSAVKSDDDPEVIVLEFGVDKPGDMKYLTAIGKLDVAVITALGEIPVHVANFPSKEGVWREKMSITKGLKDGGVLVYNADDAELRNRAAALDLRKMSFGRDASSGVRAANVSLMRNDVGIPSGLTCEIQMKGQPDLILEMPRLSGEHMISSVLAAVAAGGALGVQPENIKNVLDRFESPRGRMKWLAGINESFILDDTYNASPASTKAALALLKECSPKRRIAILGDMLELGEFSEKAHKDMGSIAAESCDMLCVVGNEAMRIKEGALDAGFSSSDILRFASSAEAAGKIRGVLKPGDAVLVKGSQGMRMERIVEAVMAEPEKKSELLVRQDAGWQRA